MTRCPLCGFEYQAEPHAGCAGCPMAGACTANCCPRCGYRTPAESHLGKLMKRLVKRGAADGNRIVAPQR